jgi:hypothetical protein
MEANQEVLAEIPAPEQAATAAPATVETSAPEQTDEQKELDAAKSKTFTQEELDAAIGKRLAREQRKWERDQQQRVQESQRQVEQKSLSIDQFETPEAYAEALANVKAHELISKREQEKQLTETLETYHDKEESAREKYDDFESVAYNPNVRITDVMAQTIQSSEIGPDLAYFLGSNPKEAERISRLQPFLQAKEIGKIEAQLSAAPTKSKKTTNAPDPISPVKASGKNTPSYDTTDPRAAEKMSTSEWIAAERQRQIAKFQAKHR